MEIQKAINLLEKGSQITLILPTHPSMDCLMSAEVILQMLGKRQKNVGVIGLKDIKETLHPDSLPNLAGSRPPLKEFVITLDTRESHPAELRYEKRGDGIDIIFSPKSSPLGKELISFRHGRTLSHTAILLGIDDIEALDDEGELGPQFFVETPLITINTSASPSAAGEADLSDKTRSSVSEIVYLLLAAMSDSALDEKTASLLLAGIISATDDLRSHSAGADTLLAASELMRLGANRQNAQMFLAGGAGAPSPDLNPLLGRALVRSKTDNGTFWSFLTGEDFEKSGRGTKDVSNLITALEKNSGSADSMLALLWQNPETTKVHATFSGPRAKLESLKETAGGAFQSPHLEISPKFANFRDAENAVTLLLQNI